MASHLRGNHNVSHIRVFRIRLNHVPRIKSRQDTNETNYSTIVFGHKYATVPFAALIEHMLQIRRADCLTVNSIVLNRPLERLKLGEAEFDLASVTGKEPTNLNHSGHQRTQEVPDSQGFKRLLTRRSTRMLVQEVKIRRFRRTLCAADTCLPSLTASSSRKQSDSGTPYVPTRIAPVPPETSLRPHMRHDPLPRGCHNQIACLRRRMLGSYSPLPW
jgi:hypothetical protein